MIQDLPEEAIVIYVNKFKNAFEVLFSYDRFTRLNLPVPTLGIDYRFLGFLPFRTTLAILVLNLFRMFSRKPQPDLFRDGYLKNHLIQGRSVFLSLVEKGDFYQRFVRKKTDPLKWLIDFQKETARPVFIVPQLFFYTEKPPKNAMKLTDIIFGYDQNPGITRKIFKSLARPEKMFVELSAPLNLKAYVQDKGSSLTGVTHLALMLRRDLLLQMTRHRQSTTGPVLKSHDEIKESVLTHEELLTYMKKYAGRKNMPLYRARQEAVRYFDEIAAKYRPGFVASSLRIVQWLSTTIFEGIRIDKKRFEVIKRMSLNGPAIFVPCHRSHIDSMIMLYVMIQNHMSPPHFFAGKNLSFWPLGTVLRMAGAFFVRRSFQGAVFYTKVFSAYIHQLLEEGFHITVFIEGTRSRSGKLLQPQLGMINILLNAYENKACEDLIFVPVYLGYDRVPEEGAYLNEIQGGQKVPESAKQFLKIGKLLEKRFGKIYVNFADPIPLAAYLEQRGFKETEMSSKDKNRACRQLGYKIMAAIDRSTIVSPRALAACALLNTKKTIRTYEHFLDQAETYLSFLESRGVPLSEPLLLSPRRSMNQVLNLFVQGKIIESLQKIPGQWKQGDRLKVLKERRLVLDYYKNNCISHFIPAAYTSLAILSRDSFLFRGEDLAADYAFLEDLFSIEFIKDDGDPPLDDLRKTIKIFIDSSILIPHASLPDTYTLTSPNYRKLKQFAAFAKPFMESYRMVFNWYASQKKESKPAKDHIKKVLQMGHQMYENREIDNKESLSRLNIENALQYFNKKGLKGKDRTEVIHYYEKRLEAYKNELDR